MKLQTRTIYIAVEEFACPMLKTGLEWFIRWLDSSRPERKTDQRIERVNLMFLRKTADGWEGGDPNGPREPTWRFEYNQDSQAVVMHYNGGSRSELPKEIDPQLFSELVWSKVGLS